MRVWLKSALKTSSHEFDCLQDQQVLFRTGNHLAIRTVGKHEAQFVQLPASMTALLTFKASNNKKTVFTVERADRNLDVVQYQINGQRKAISLEDTPFFSDIEHWQLLTDEYDGTILYGVARNKETACVFLADFGKGRLLANGYLPAFSDAQVDGRQSMRLSVCGHNGSHNYLKTLQYGLGQWEIVEQPLKKLQGMVIRHEILPMNRTLLLTATALHILQDEDITKTIEIPQDKGPVTHALKIPRGLLLRHKDFFRAYAQEGEEGSFLEAGEVELQLEEGEKVHGVSLSLSGEEVWLRTDSNSFYVWRCESVGLDAHQNHTFTQIERSSGSGQLGSLSMSAGRKYALLTDPRSASLWSIERNECVLGSEFREGEGGRGVLTGAVHPDGNSLLLAFEDKLRLYLVLLAKFKLQAEFSLRRCRTLIFSHSGLLAACHFGRNANSSLTVINLQRLTEICTFKIGAQPTQIFWNELDDQLFVASDNNAVQVYKIADQIRKHQMRFDETVTHARIDYRSKRLVVSTERSIFLVEEGKVVEKLPMPFPDCRYVFPLHGHYLAAGHTGNLYCSNNLKFQNATQLPLFTNAPFTLLSRNGYLLASRGLTQVLVLQITRSAQKKRAISDQIAMVEREQILGFFQKVRNIQNSYDMLVTATHLRQEEDKHRYDAAIAEVRQKYQQELEFANTQYLASSVQQARGVKQNEKMFENLQQGQANSVADLQRMYERRATLDREKIMNLEQECLEQKLRSEKLMVELQARHSAQIQRIREEYGRRSREESEVLGREKLRHLEDKRRVEMRLLDIEEESEFTLVELQSEKDATIGQLRVQLKRVEEHSERLMAQQQNLRGQLSRLKSKEESVGVLTRNMEESLRQAQNRTQLLEREVQRLQGMVGQRDQVVKEQELQIGALEKAKYVLSFRTTEIRKDLQPKEHTIDKLKAELLNLDQEYRNEKRKAFEMGQRVEKLQAVNGASKREISGLKIALKCQERSHDELCSDIYTVVNNIDSKDWNGELVKIYQKYIREERHSSRRDVQRDDTCAEVTRHLAHVEQSLVQVSGGADRLLRGKEKEVVRKMKENSELVYELNVMRKKENEYSREKKELVSENARLKRQTGESSARHTTRAHTANTGFTRRVVPSREGASREKSATLDISGTLPSREERRQVKREKSRLVSARRTLMLQDQMKQKGGKFFDIAQELENARGTIRRQDRMIEELNHRLLGMPEN